MNSIACRLAGVWVFLCLFGGPYPAQPQSNEALRPMPKSEAVEQMPSPRALGSETVIWDEAPAAVFYERPLHWTRVNRYEIWQLYEVGHYGRFRPRVIYSASGSFYLDDGR